MKINNLIRILDVLISALFLMIVSPIILVIFLLIYFIDGKPIIFKQTRVGQNGRKFQMLKFRTMKNQIYKNENNRLTRLGKILRRSSIDEIPQFLNVLKNEMSIVGPRPLPEVYEKKINNKFRYKRRKILPGITGLSQIHYSGKFRKTEDKVNLDIKYFENYTLLNYLNIIIKTPFVLIIRLIKNKSSIIK